MSTSGTESFNPSLADLVINAYGRIQIRPHQLTAQHLVDARMCANLILQEWGNRGLALWCVELHTPIPLVALTPTYNLDIGTVNVLDAYISLTSNGVTTDRIIRPIGRTDYANQANKLAPGNPTAFWFYRGVQPQITLYQNPDATLVRTLNLWVMRRIQDAVPVMGQTADVEDRYLAAFVSALTAALAEIWAPMMWAAKVAMAEKSWNLAAAEDGEKVDVYIRPQMGGYYDA